MIQNTPDMLAGGEHRDELQILVSLALSSPLYARLIADESIYQAVQTAIVQRIAELTASLGIPGQPSIEIVSINANAQRKSYWLRLTVHRKLCRYPWELLKRVYSYITDHPLLPDAQLNTIVQWLSECSLDIAESRDLFIAFLSETCVEIIKRQPQVLLDLPQVAVYIASLPMPVALEKIQPVVWPPDQAWLHPILSTVLAQKISLKDTETVANTLYISQDRSSEVISEALITALRPTFIEIQLSPEYLKQLTITLQAGDATIFDTLRSELLRETGLRYPDFRFVLVPGFRPNTVAFKIHHVTLLPWKGLNSDQRLANMTSATLRETYHVEGIAASNPYYWWEFTLIPVSDDPTIQQYCWTPLGYLYLCFKATLIEHASCFIHSTYVQEQLDQFERNFPDLIRTVRSKFPVGYITHVLRRLIMQKVLVGNLPFILDRLLDYEFLSKDHSKVGIIDNSMSYFGPLLGTLWTKDPEFIISFLRTGMKRIISNAYANGTNTIYACYLDPVAENLILERRQQGNDQEKTILLNENECDRLLDGLHTQMTRFSSVDYTPVLLTQLYDRPILQEIIAAEIPRVAVIATQELHPMNVEIKSIEMPLLSFG